MSGARIYQLGPGFDPLATSDGYDSPLTREEALSVAACSRAVDLVSTTVAGLPLERVDEAGRRVDLGWVAQPEATRPRFATLVDTVRDLYLDGVAYWQILRRDANGEPARGGVRYLPLNRVGYLTETDGSVTLTYDGVPIPRRDTLGFHGWHDGIRRHGARVLRTALALDQAAKRMADAPLPNTLLKNASTYELDDDEIDELIAGVKAARQASAIGYINAGVELETLGWDSAELQLVEARQYAAASVANLCGVPAAFIAGASATGASLTYSNVTQEARSLVDFGLTPPIKAIESRLSMSDVLGQAWTNQVTPRGSTVRFNLNGLLRGNPLERAQVYAVLVPLGVLTVEEARALEDLAPEGNPQA